jgi:hypothetical protein
MVVFMKTTMNLPDALLGEVKRRAAVDGRTVTSVMEEALRAYLERPTVDHERVSLPTWSGGSQDGYLVDITDRDALWDRLDDAS